MGKMPDIGWMDLFAGDRETGRPPSMRLQDAQLYFEVGDRVGFFTAPARRLAGVTDKLNPRNVPPGIPWREPRQGLIRRRGPAAGPRLRGVRASRR